MCVCVSVCVCMYVYMFYVCMYVCMYVYVYMTLKGLNGHHVRHQPLHSLPAAVSTNVHNRGAARGVLVLLKVAYIP